MDVIIARVQRVVRREPGVFREIADDPRAFTQGMLITFVATLVGGLGAIVRPGRFDVTTWVLTAIAAATLGVVIGTLVVWGLGRLFGGRARYDEMGRVYAHANVAQVLAIVPFVGSIASAIAFAVLLVRALEEVMGLTRVQAIVVVVIPLVMLGALFALGMLALRAGMTSGSVAP
ncbi:MAG: YIP1 family protein [Actinomycetes bacterium]